VTPTHVVPDWLAAAFEALVAGDVDGWASMYAADAVHELPFAPGGREIRLEGREEIAARLREVFDRDEGRLRFGSFDDVRVREVGDEVIVEGEGRHHRSSDGSPVTIRCIWFITRHDGEVTRFRDYMDPRPLTTHEL
jgi:uncharacterized protein